MAKQQRVWEYRTMGEREQGEQWAHEAYWLAQHLGTAHSARYLVEAANGVELWETSAGEGHAHGATRLVFRVRESGRLWCSEHWGHKCSHAGAVICFMRVHGARVETQAA